MELIAFYLPQFHPIPENDEWWGKGFTEWTNVAKAKPLFKGHQQPKIPADLGFYDLRLPQSRQAQADLAQKYGVTAFCYWHYWFGNGKKLLNYPFEEVVRLGEPVFPFCLAWANHSWYNKSWTTKQGHFSLEKSQLLIEQSYPGEEDYIAHFYDLLEAFKDKRYLKIHGKLLFVVFNPTRFDDFPLFKKVWNELANKEGLPGFYFVGHMFQEYNLIDDTLMKGYDAINLSLHHKPFIKEGVNKTIEKWRRKIRSHFAIKPQIVSYSKAINLMDSSLFERSDIIPTIIPNWDHTPRSGNYGRVLYDCNPKLFKKHVSMILTRVKKKAKDDQVIFIKSWNEWGEGNYLEPDLLYGTSHLEALKESVDMFGSKE